MAYDGGKSAAGVYQTIINQIPPHHTYIEPFLGNGGIMRKKRPAERNVGVEIDPQVLGEWNGGEVPGLELYRGDGLAWLKHEFRLDLEAGPRLPASRSAASLPGAVVYCDPPYPRGTRRNGGKMYRHEMTDQQHAELLDVLDRLPARVLVSSYWSELYADALSGWRLVRFTASTRRGPAEECLWMNYPPPDRLHDSRYVGRDKRERERIRRRSRNWRRTLESLAPLERQAILDALNGW
jgi:DNA adenine methylase